MGSFLIGTGVTIVTFYIALIYGSIAIGLIGFAELVLMLLACLYLLIYCRHITADIRIPLTVAEKGKKVTVQLTVDQKMGEIRDEKGCSVVDLPGIYSLRPYTQEEIVSRDFIINQKPDGIINIVDATNIERLRS